MPSHEDGVTAVEVVDPLVGTIFDKRFRVEERLAAGGFGAIYRATHVKSGHEIALKVLHPNLASDLGVLARFRREGTTLTSLRNPHTITAYEFGQSDRILFIVLELLHGETLFDRYSVHGPMEWKRVVHIAKQVCESLEEAHAQGIVHRDLKPTNIHLEHHDGDPDYVKVLDFGIAKILRGSEHDASDITNAGQMIGTLDYMSPEQMVGGQVTGQTDIYTLGIVMYEMIAGTRPFPESMTATAALAAMLKLTPEPLYLRSPIPRELDAIVMRCLERETQKRYRTVAELRADLERVVGDPISPTTATVQISKRNFEDNDETAVTPAPESLIAATRSPAARAPASPEDTLRKPKADLKTPRVEIKLDPQPKTPRLERVSEQEVKTPRLERAKSQNLGEWDEEDSFAPTTTRRPDGQDDVPAPASRAPAAPLKPTSRPPKQAASSIPATPRPRPLESRHQATPVPQLVVAPFSPTPRPRPPTGQIAPAQIPGIPSSPAGVPSAGMPPMSPGVPPMSPGVPSTGAGLPPGVPPMSPGVSGVPSTGVPGMPPGVPSMSSGVPSSSPGTLPDRRGTTPGFAPGVQLPPPIVPNSLQRAPMPYGSVAPPPGSYDMSKIAARDAAMRRMVWIVLFAIAGIAAVIVATRL